MATSAQYDDIMAVFVCFDGLARNLALKGRSTLSKTQVLIMMAIDTLGPMNMTQTSKRLAITKEQASRAVAPLVKLGYVERSRSADNHKVVNISLTDSGEKCLAEHHALIFEDLSDALAPLSQEETAQLARLSHDSVKLLKKALNTHTNA